MSSLADLWLSDLKMYGRFGRGLRSFLHRTISAHGARSIVRQRLEEREANFLRLIERGLFGYPGSPYLPLLKRAGCRLDDVLNMVRAAGVESTLRALWQAGVYFTFEEFKGREPVVRTGKST